MELTDEQTSGLQYLAETRDALVAAVESLSDAQANFTTGPGRWSAAEIVEHLAIVETFVSTFAIKELLESSALPAGAASESDESLKKRLTERTSKVSAPERLHPAGRTIPESLKLFVSRREKVADCLRNHPDLRNHSRLHPALGPLDGYQWILTVAGHTERHRLQILEIKADPNYPPA